MVVQAQTSTRPSLPLAVSAWLVMLAARVLPNALFHELAGSSLSLLLGAKTGMLAIMASVTFIWKDIPPIFLKRTDSVTG